MITFFLEKGFNGVIRKNLGEFKQLFNNLLIDKPFIQEMIE